MAETGRKVIANAVESLFSTEKYADTGFQLLADSGNLGVIYVGSSTITSGTTPSTDGFPLARGDVLLYKTRRGSDIYTIGNPSGQVLWYGIF